MSDEIQTCPQCQRGQPCRENEKIMTEKEVEKPNVLQRRNDSFAEYFRVAKLIAYKTFREISGQLGGEYTNSIGYLCDLEKGRRKTSDLKFVARLEEILGVTDGSLVAAAKRELSEPNKRIAELESEAARLRAQRNSLTLSKEAYSSLGIYGQNYFKDGVSHKRTEWQEGWNAACLEASKRVCDIHSWIKGFPDGQKLLIGDLISENIIDIDYAEDDETFYLYLLMNDTFAYACADAETLSVGDLPEVALIYKQFSYDGLTAWAAKRRNMEPIKEWQTERYLLARQALRAGEEGAG